VAIIQIERSLQFSFGLSDGWKECKSARWTSNAIHRILIRQTQNLAARETRPLRSGSWTIELTAVPQFQVRFHDLLHSDPGRSRSQRRPRGVRPSDPPIHPQDRKPATVPRGQPSGPKASPELGMVSPDPVFPDPVPGSKRLSRFLLHFAGQTTWSSDLGSLRASRHEAGGSSVIWQTRWPRCDASAVETCDDSNCDGRRRLKARA
jgi:hypothetical protein